VKIEKLINRVLVPGACSSRFLETLDGWCFRGAQSLWCKAQWNSREPLIKLWRLPHTFCMGLVTSLKVLVVAYSTVPWWTMTEREKNTVSY
jgi:hypothetical protein